MASSPSPRSKNSLEATLLYFSKYGFPLTSDELWFWQHFSKISKFKIRNLNSNLKFQISNWKLRKQREVISKKKWLIANRVGKQLSKIKFIEAIFVTGSLAMSNCTSDADIDLMIVTSPNTLWLTRPLVYLLLSSTRRKPQVTSAPDKICDNLYLDTYCLPLTTHNLYLAHEILQAKCLFDRGGIHRRFLEANAWVKNYLPIAYREILKTHPHPNPTTHNSQLTTILLYSINLLLFCLQYLYMRSKMTTERVGPGFAFFHPASSLPS